MQDQMRSDAERHQRCLESEDEKARREEEGLLRQEEEVSDRERRGD